MASQPKIDLDELNKTLQSILPIAKGKRQLPPVESWDPPYCGDIGLEIRKDGSWWHQGSIFKRDKLVALFASILRKDADDKTYVVTPHEKVLVHVEDAHFIGVRVDQAVKNDQNIIVLTTNLGDVVELGNEHPLRVETDPQTGEPAPYVLVRGRLEAKLTRAAFYELVEMAELQDDKMLVNSHGVVFMIGQVGPE